MCDSNNCGCGTHEDSKGCGCGVDVDSDLIVTLTLDNNEDVDCAVVCIFPVGDKEYISLIPLNKDGSENEDGTVYIYGFNMVDGQPELDNIETDDEYEAAADAFDAWLDEQEFDEMQAALDIEE